MSISVTSRHFKAHPSLHEYAEEAVQRLDRFYDGIIKAEVILSFERSRNSRKSAEINLAVYNAVLTGHCVSDDFFRSIDTAAAKLRNQLKRYKEKLHLRDRQGVRRVRAKD